jgi:hypothetical protein
MTPDSVGEVVWEGISAASIQIERNSQDLCQYNGQRRATTRAIWHKVTRRLHEHMLEFH